MLVAGAESKDPPQVAPILILPTVQFLGVHAGVHQTDQRLARKLGFEPLTYPTNLPALCSSPRRFAKHIDGPTPALPVQAGEHSEATRQRLQASRDAGAQLGLTRKRIQRMNPMSICGGDRLLQTRCCRSILPDESRQLSNAVAESFQHHTSASGNTKWSVVPCLNSHRPTVRQIGSLRGRGLDEHQALRAFLSDFLRASPLGIDSDSP